MCLSIPARILKIEGMMADVSVGGAVFKAGLQLVADVCEGDYILLHAGFAIRKISEKEAQETLDILNELNGAGGNNIL